MGQKYEQPTFNEKFLAFLTRLLPKIGPLKVLKFVAPTPQTEKMFEASFNATLTRYRGLLTQVGNGHLELANDNFDTGEASGPGVYFMNDDTYAKLLDKLADEKFAGAPPELRADMLKFYGDPNGAYSTKKDPKAWAKVQAELEQLKAVPPYEAPPPKPAADIAKPSTSKP